jgi:hypothetical protein
MSPLNPDPPMTTDDLFAWIALAGLMAAILIFG